MKATRGPAPRPVEDRLHAKLVQKPNGCVEYAGATSYGRISIRTDGGWTMALAHRLAWEMAHGPIPLGLYVCHHCDNPPCCNPDHLFLGTNSENLRDLSSKGLFPQQRRTHCPRNHPYDEANTYVCPKGKRICRACRNEGARRRWHTKADPRVKK